MKILTLTLLLFSLNLLASDCPEYNLLEDHQILKTMEVKNQGSFSTCYAHSLSAAYEAKTGKELHPYSIAFEHKKRLLHWTPYNLNYSLASFAWKDVKKKGVCEAFEVEKRLDSFRTNDSYNDDQLIYAIKAFFPHKESHKAIKELLEDSFLDGTSWLESDLTNLYAKLSHYPQKKFFDFLEEVILKDCHKEYPSFDLESTGLGFQSNNSLIKNYTTRLELGEPSVIGYCSHHMQEENYHSVKPRALLSVMPGCGAHYVILVGQKEIKNKCNVLIRNSHSDHFWGHANQSCLCKDSMGDTRLCEKENFKKDVETVIGCYYDRDLFMNETFDVSYLK